jgi:pimeloyl-ACP methyl ester carboxylesterase
VADGLKVAARARADFGSPLYLWGESLGCGVAAALAVDEETNAKGVVMLTPWDTLLHAAKAHFPWLPVRALTRDRYDSVAHLSGYPGPVAVLMAERDEVIPPDLARNLYRGLPEPKRLWVFDGAGHNSWPTGPAEPFWAEVMTFLEGSAPSAATSP